MVRTAPCLITAPPASARRSSFSRLAALPMFIPIMAFLPSIYHYCYPNPYPHKEALWTRHDFRSLYGKHRYYANSKPTETRRPIGPQLTYNEKTKK